MGQCLLALLKQGDHVVCFVESYPATLHMIKRLLGRFGVSHTMLSIEDPEGVERTLSENGVKLGTLVDQGVKRFRYLYDFGDGWEHEVAIEKVQPLDPGQQYPSLIAGKRACPPEDCGGVPGYAAFLKAIRNPRHPEHEDLLAWAGGRFDPGAFDLAAVNRRLRRVK